MAEGRVDGRTARELNDVIRYTAWSVFKSVRPLGDADRTPVAAELDQLIEQLAAKDVIVRGTYDVSALRADAAFEADELHRIVDLMRHLRASGARRHVREEVPFYTGRRRSPADLVAALP